MAAPSGIVWGSVAYGNGETGRSARIGIYVTTSSTATETTATVQVWFWSKYGVSDNLGNHLYLDDLASSGTATTDRGGSNIQTTVSSGSGWSTSNQVLLTSKSYTFKHTRGAKATRYLSAKLTGVDRVAATMTASTTYTVPAAEYSVSYNANGGIGAPSKQTKTHGVNLTISNVKPTRTGYSFQGWALTKAAADDGTWYYSSGSTCGKNENLTLYAVWKANTYSVSYNANDGTGAPSKQTKTYGVTLKLSTTKPTRTNYNFLGWSISKNGSVVYKPGDNYTANAAVTLYAVWELAYVKPRIKNFSVFRCSEDDDSIDDNGTALGVSFEWATDRAIQSATVSWTPADDEGEISTTLYLSGTGGMYVDQGLWAGFNLETTYQVALTIRDGDSDSDYSAAFATLPGMNYAIDFKPPSETASGGAAFNKPAELSGVLDINLKTYLRGGLQYITLEPETDLNDVQTPGFYVGENVSNYNYVNCPITKGTFTLEVLSGGDNGQIWQRLTLCDKSISATYERFYYGSSWPTDANGTCEWVRTSDFGGTLLWQGVYHMSGSQTVTLAEPVHKQNNGIILVFSRYSSGVARDYHFNHAFVHKMFVKLHPGVGNTFLMTTDGSFSVMATKYLYIHDDRIDGNANNEATGTGTSGVKYENNGFVLRYVIGV